MKDPLVIDCRMVGPGGTTLMFYPTPEGIMAVWTNENCPYEGKNVTFDKETWAASDGHNVSMISWEDWEAMSKRKP